MQSGISKNEAPKRTRWPLLFLIAFLAFTCQPAASQISSHRLHTADSLFEAKRYTQSLSHYEQILAQNEYTPAMLLKMAFIQEGLLNIGMAMYYLNLYYVDTNDTAALEKMSELARKYNLEGYSVEYGGFATFYHNYHLYITIALSAMMLLFFSIVVYTRLRIKVRPAISFAFLSLFAVMLSVHLYYGLEKPSGVITQPRTYVMSGPSAGASVVDIIGDGHKVQVIGREDVWLKIRWRERTAYIRENSLLPIRL